MLEHLGIGITLSMQDEFSPKADTAVASMTRLEQGADHLHRSMGESMSSLQNLMLSGFSMGQIGEKFDSFGSHIVGSFKNAYSELATIGSKFENFKIRFDTFFKDMSDKKLDWGLKFAEKTPFRLEETLDAMTSFKVMGMDVDRQFQTTIKNGKELHTVTKDMMTALGDIGALKPEQGIAGAMYAIREWFGGSKKSFKNRFEIDPEQALGRKISTSNPEQFMKDWIEFSEIKAPGLLNKLSDSWLTITDNIEDAIEIIKYKISKQDVFKSVKKTARDLYVFLNNIDVNKLGKAVGNALSAIWKPVDLVVHGLMKLTVAFMNFSSAHPVLTKMVVGFVALNGIAIALTGKLLKLAGGFLILTTSMVSAYTNLKLLNTFSDLSIIFSGLGRGLHRIMYTFKLLGLVVGAFAIAWHTNFMGMRDSTTGMVKHFTTSWGNAKRALDEGIDSSVLRIIGWRGMATQMGIPFDNLTRNLMKLQLVGLIVRKTLFGETVHGDIQYTTKELRNLESMGLLPLAQTFALLRGRASAFFKGLMHGLGTTWGMIREYGNLILKPIKIVLSAIGLNLDNIKNTIVSIFGVQSTKGMKLSVGQKQIADAKNLGRALGGVLGVMLGFKAVRMITPIILAPFRALNKTIKTSVDRLNSLKRLMTKTGATSAVQSFAEKHPFSPVGKYKRIRDRTNSFINEYNAVPVLGKKDKNGYQRVNGGIYDSFKNYGLKSNPNVKDVNDLYAREKVRGLGKLLGYQYYQKDSKGDMQKVGSFGGRLKLGRDNAQNKLFAQMASKEGYNALGSYQVKGKFEEVKDKYGKPVLDSRGNAKRRYVPTTTTDDVYASRRRAPILDNSIGTMGSIFKGAGYGSISGNGQTQLKSLRMGYEKQLRDLVRDNRGSIEARTGKKLNMRSFNVPPGMDGKLEENIKQYKRMLSKSGVDISGIKRDYANNKGRIIRNNTLTGGGAQVFEANRGKVRTALFGRQYYKINRDNEGNLYRQTVGKQGGLLRRKSKDLFSNGQANLSNASLSSKSPQRTSVITKLRGSRLSQGVTGGFSRVTSAVDNTLNAGASRLGGSFLGRGFSKVGRGATSVINSQRKRLGLSPISGPKLPKGRNIVTRVAKGGWSATKGAGKFMFGRSRLEAIKDNNGNIVGKRRVGGGLISRSLRGGGKLLGGAGKLIGGAGSLALGMAPYLALGTMAFKGMSARGSRIGKDKKRMTQLFGKGFAKQKHSPIEIMLKDAENRMRKVNPNKLYAKFKSGAKKTFPIIKQIALTAFRQLKKVLPSILNDAWTGLKAGAKLAWIWIKTNGVQMFGQFVGWVGSSGIPKLLQFLGKVGVWIISTGIPKLIELAGTFLTWIVSTGIPKLIKGICKLGVWVMTTGLPTLGGKILGYIPTIAKGIFNGIVNGLKGLPGALMSLLGSGIKSLPVIGKPIANMLGIHHGGLWMSPDEHPAVIKKDETVLPPALSKRFNDLFTTATPVRDKPKTKTGPSKVDNSVHINKVEIIVKADKLSRSEARSQAKQILQELKSMQKEEDIRAFAY